MTSNGQQGPQPAPAPVDAEAPLVSYGLRIFAESPEGFVVEIVADETDRPIDWIQKQTAGLARLKFKPVNPFPGPAAAPAPAAAPQRPPGGQGGAQRPQGRPNGQQGGQRAQGGQGGRQGGGGGGRGAGGGYRGPIYDVCPWDGADVYDNRQRKADGWRGPFFGCKNGRDCGWAVWRSDGSYDE